MSFLALILIAVSPFSTARASDCGCTQALSLSNISQISQYLNTSDRQNNAVSAQAKVTLSDSAGKPFVVSVLSPERTERAFRAIASRDELGWDRARSGCEMRANQSAYTLLDHGIQSGKIFAEGALVARPRAGGDEFYGWSWHVANFVVTNVDGKPVKFVLDPAVADKPLTVEEWAKALTSIPGTSLKQLHFTNRFSYDGADRKKSLSTERTNVRQRDIRLLSRKR